MTDKFRPVVNNTLSSSLGGCGTKSWETEAKWSLINVGYLTLVSPARENSTSVGATPAIFSTKTTPKPVVALYAFTK